MDRIIITSTTTPPTTTPPTTPVSSIDFSGNYTIAGTYNGGPAWQHETKSYLTYFDGAGAGWMFFPGTIDTGPTNAPVLFQGRGYPCGELGLLSTTMNSISLF